MTPSESPRILVVGSANIDLVTRVPRCPQPGESLIGSSFATIPGGKGANQAVAAARLGARVHFAGCVGSDSFGALQHETLAADGIDTTHLKTHPDEPTGTAVILVAETGQNAIVVTPAANFGITPEDIAALEPLFEDLDAVLLQLEIPLESVEATLDLARAHGVLSILDAGPAQAVDSGLIAKADIVSPNETEAEAITGIGVHAKDDAPAAADKLIEMGAGEVVLKLGAHGAYYQNREGDRLHTPAFAVDPVDTVAAGDAFTAALACTWNTLERNVALRYANATGALATTQHGAQPAMPTRAAVDTFLTEHDAK
jgi:ribokinase